MPISVDLIGQTTEVITHEVDARWLMAYAAGLGCTEPAYMDTAAGTLIPHPVFPVCLEWPANLAIARLPGYADATLKERARGVHYGHDLHLLRPIKAGETLTTEARVIGIEQRPSGAAQTMRFDTRDVPGALVAQTFQTSIYRGVPVAGESRLETGVPPLPTELADVKVGSGEVDLRVQIPVEAGAAHVYTECARIFNPIHTDRAVALAAGLPDIILHGTATLALAVSELIKGFADGNPARVKRLGGRFSAMVLMPGMLSLRARRVGADTVVFEVDNDQGQVAIKSGFIVVR